MKVIIAGSRRLSNLLAARELARAIVESKFEITEVVSGAAKGIDLLGENWALLHNVPVKRFPANWQRFGRAAGFIRNGEMAEYADALIAVWDGRSQGTQNMIAEARNLKLPTHVHIVERK